MVGKVVVTDLEGNSISFWRATWRFLLILLSWLFFPFTLIGVIFFRFINKNKRSLHDILAGTLVTKKPSP